MYIYIFHIHSQTGNVANVFSKFCSVRLSAPKNTNGGWQFDFSRNKLKLSDTLRMFKRGVKLITSSRQIVNGLDNVSIVYFVVTLNEPSVLYG